MTADTIDTNKLWDLIKDIRFAMFTARHGDGRLHSRPMITQNSQANAAACCGSSCRARASRWPISRSIPR